MLRVSSVYHKVVEVGKEAEAAVKAAEVAEGSTILGEQVAVRTSKGLRRVDMVVQKASGELVNVESKAAKASRTSSQVAKDSEIATTGGTYTGKNAPNFLQNVKQIVRTIVRKPDNLD